MGAVPLVLGVLLGFKLYYLLNDLAFRKLILVVLFLSGSALIVPEVLVLL
jgi:hypothetical protein